MAFSDDRLYHLPGHTMVIVYITGILPVEVKTLPILF